MNAANESFAGKKLPAYKFCCEEIKQAHYDSGGCTPGLCEDEFPPFIRSCDDSLVIRLKFCPWCGKPLEAREGKD